MQRPLLHIQPQTCLMIADYHKGANNTPDANEWYRTALVLQAVMSYNDGTWNDESLRNMLSTAFTGTDDAIDAHVRELIRT